MDPLRRSLVKALGAAGALGAAPRLVRANAPLPPPEVDTVRVVKFPSICQAPVFIAEELLRAEGFTGFTYVEAEAPGAGPGSVEVMNKGLADIASFFAAPLAIAIDRGADISVLGGMHPGCFELFTRPEIKSVKDLKGKTVSVLGNESGQHVFLASIVTYVGLDPARDIRWDFNPPEKGKQLLAEGKIDGYLGFPPDPQELRDRKVGRMLLSSTYDRPWSQYFCCMVAVNKTWRRKHPIATKRVMRAILKGGDICTADPDAGVRAFMARGFKPKVEYARQALTELPYRSWRDFSAEDSLRFYALQLREAGMVRGTPQKIIERGTDWSVLEELKRELKA